MGKDSSYYKNKRKDQIRKLRELLSFLPGFAIDYIHDKELATQTSTLISYSYDLLTFFRFLKERNPILNKKEIVAFTLQFPFYLSLDSFPLKNEKK